MHARFSAVVLLAAMLGACKSVEVPKLPGVTPYRMVIQQGNFISDEMVAQLKPGMTKEQVRFVLGTPLVTDIFHADRWDYVFFREMPNGKREQRNLSVVFQDGKLQRVIGDLLPDPNAPKPAPTAKPSIEPKPAGEEPKPAAEAKPAAEPAKPAQATESWEPTKQNWGSAPVEEPKPAPAAKQEEPKPAGEPKAQEPRSEVATEAKQEPVSEEKKERGFFGRVLEKIGL
jgi:outer membrane protein assembly factor BamE